MYIIAQVLLGSYVVYLFLGMQKIVLSIIYGWAVLSFIHIPSGVIGTINYEETWLSVTFEDKII